jgi:quercetin dioxygenase-like cupin family protein
MEIKRSGSQPSGKGPAEYFTGTVRIDPLFNPPAPARALGASVTFEPGARTAWLTHPLGQTLIVTAGCGRVQRWGEPVEEIRPGDVVWIPPGEKHWHGATAARRQGRRVDGTGQRRTIRGLSEGQKGTNRSKTHVQGEGLLRRQCDIATCLYLDRAARSK